MQTLRVLDVEDGAIIVASPAGERFRLPLDAALRARLHAPAVGTDEKRLSPREIQSHVRAGLTAEQVAAMTGVPVASIERFVGPVLAERAYLIESALKVRLPPETEGARSRTFGAVMGERLDTLAARDVRWTSAKEPSGWILAVAFVADDVQHNARWRFDPKHMRLDPDNVEASTLSQQGVPAALTPRLRAIEPTAPVTIVPPAASAPAPAPVQEERAALHGARVAPVPRVEPDRSRFDSAAFHFPPLREDPALAPASPVPAEPRPATASERPVATTQRPVATAGPTTDQLAQLSRRRGQRVPSPEVPDLPITQAMDVAPPGDVFAPRPASERQQAEPERAEAAPIRRLPVRPASDTQAAARSTEPLRRRRDRAGRGAFGQTDPTGARTVESPDAPEPVSGRPRRGRTSMPSWDEIVFGRDE